MKLIMKKNQILNLALFVLAIAVFLWFSEKYMYFTYDDSFIIYRYADNLANGYGFSWNYDGIPEAGFTSYLHTILVAGGIKLGFDPIPFGNAVTIFSGIITIFVVGLIVREFTDRKFEYYFLSSLVLGFLPVFGIHAISGMETIMFVMFFTLSAYSYLAFLRTNKRKHLAILVSLIVITSFTRYEGALLCIGIIVHQIFNNVALKNPIDYKKIGIFCIPIIFLVGVVMWNYSQFEQFLPNPFFMKSTTEVSDLFRNSHSIATALVLMIAHLLLIAISFKEIIKNPKSSYFIIQIVVVLIPFLFIAQWGNFQHRYYMHIFPLIISLSIFSFYIIKPKIIQGQKHPKFIIAIVLLLLVSYTLPTNWEVTAFADNFSNAIEASHIKIGKILGAHDDLKHNTIATVIDAGAVPYYSKWKVYDYTFNDRYTTQNGFSADYFYQQNPVIITLTLNSIHHPTLPFNQDDLAHFEDRIIESLQKRGDPWVLHPKFENYEIIASYPSIMIIVEKEFARQNPQLMQELIDNSSHT